MVRHLEPRSPRAFERILEHTDPRVARVLEYIGSHYADRLTLDSLSKKAGISKYHFIKLFRQATGETPLAFVSRVRLTKALELLGTTEMSVTDIAIACGYPRSTHFATAFLGRYGITPSEMRSRRR